MERNIRKTLRKYAFNAYSRLAWHLSAPWHCGRQADRGGQRCEMLIVVIAYNSEHLIGQQIQLIKENITDKNFRLIVADNSVSSRRRAAIRQICENHGITYIPVPRHITCLTHYQCAISHGAALNWVYYHYLLQQSPLRFALIDHDIFPTKPYSLTGALGDRDFYGVARIFNGEWYLWPGWCIYQFDKFTTAPDFLPRFTKKNFLDTGGGNYRLFYCRYDVGKVAFPEVKTWRHKLTQGLSRRCDIYHSDYLQSVDNAWLHLINGANYANIPGKEDTISQILSSIMQQRWHP